MTPRPIRRLLVANRGEIASRIIRTASSMGISTVAVHAASDATAPFVAQADAAVALDGRGPAETYLDMGQLLGAARATGADAVHPGYGFLSERAAFATAVLDAGLTWVGPPPAAIAAMGDKLAAKELMAAAGVPVLASHRVRGTALPDIPPGDYPVLVKAAAGGGGRGMRVVTSPDGLADAVAAASREAGSAFGDPTVFVERYLAPARHVEVQVLADGHGNVLHVFERECSIQRRHQKIVEEAPSPAVDPQLRGRLTAAAVDAAVAVGYVGAGTVEFVLDGAGDPWFLEMNTRLQVEHPVTEAVTGLDLVREQLRVAEGHRLSVTQDDLRIDGWAVEARLYAEDPAAGFLPVTGTLLDWAPPASPAVRVDAGVATGSVVGIEWDPMLAKVVSHAPTRTEAALALALALERFRVRGVTTNRDHLVAILRSAAFLDGDTTTDFVDRIALPRRAQPPAAEVEVAAIAAALAAREERRASAVVLPFVPTGWRNSVMPAERSRYLGPDGIEVEVTWRAGRDGSLAVTAGTSTATAVVRSWDGRHLVLGVDDLTQVHDVLLAGDRAWVATGSGDVQLTVLPRFADPVAAEVAGTLAAPMPGRVVVVHVVPGATVAAGDALVVVEAMKMEHRVTAPAAGTVTEVRVAVGDQVAAGDALVVVDGG